MSNSALVTYKNVTNNRNSPRNHTIDTITIHCYVGQVTAKQGCDYFKSTDRQVSANYVVGCDGSIGLSVPESDRAWTSSSGTNDHRAVTIECACDSKSPYALTDKAYNALINLVADICKRNGIKQLVWSTNSSDRKNHKNGCNMTVHRDFASTDCPGAFLYSNMGEIAKQVNKKLAATDSFLPSIGYYKKGDISPNVEKICDFLADLVKGDTFGDYCEACVKVYQQKHGIGTDGKVGKKTLAAMEKDGFKK